jgi:hypothetical protein
LFIVISFLDVGLPSILYIIQIFKVVERWLPWAVMALGR